MCTSRTPPQRLSPSASRFMPCRFHDRICRLHLVQSCYGSSHVSHLIGCDNHGLRCDIGTGHMCLTDAYGTQHTHACTRTPQTCMRAHALSRALARARARSSHSWALASMAAHPACGCLAPLSAHQSIRACFYHASARLHFTVLCCSAL